MNLTLDDTALMPHVTATEYTTREAWLAGRMGSTGASSAATMFGVGWRTPLQEYAIATGAMDPPAETEQMRMGHVMQPVARDLFEEETGYITKDWGEFTILRNVEFPHMHVTLDYPIMLGLGKDCERKAPAVLECKNVGPFMVQDWEDGEIPLDVQMQVQQQLAITGWEWGAVAAILAGGRFVFDFVERNEDFIQTLTSRVAAFWQNVKDGTPPTPTADDGEALRLLHPKHVVGKTIDLDDDMLANLDVPGVARREKRAVAIRNMGEMFQDLTLPARLFLAKSVTKTLEEQIDEDQNLLKAQFGDAEIAILPDGTRYSYKRQVRKAHQVKESESRVLRRLKT